MTDSGKIDDIRDRVRSVEGKLQDKADELRKKGTENQVKGAVQEKVGSMEKGAGKITDRLKEGMTHAREKIHEAFERYEDKKKT